MKIHLDFIIGIIVFFVTLVQSHDLVSSLIWGVGSFLVVDIFLLLLTGVIFTVIGFIKVREDQKKNSNLQNTP